MKKTFPTTLSDEEFEESNNSKIDMKALTSRMTNDLLTILLDVKIMNQESYDDESFFDQLDDSYKSLNERWLKDTCWDALKPRS